MAASRKLLLGITAVNLNRRAPPTPDRPNDAFVPISPPSRGRAGSVREAGRVAGSSTRLRAHWSSVSELSVAPNTTNATTSKTFSSTMAAAAIKRYIHQSTHDTSSRLVGFPLCDVPPASNPPGCPLLGCAGPYRLAWSDITRATARAVSPEVARPGVTTSQGAPAARHARTPGPLEGTPHTVGQRDPYG